MHLYAQDKLATIESREKIAGFEALEVTESVEVKKQKYQSLLFSHQNCNFQAECQSN
jgi:hypothetical protein